MRQTEIREYARLAQPMHRLHEAKKILKSNLADLYCELDYLQGIQGTKPQDFGEAVLLESRRKVSKEVDMVVQRDYYYFSLSACSLRIWRY